MQRMTIPNVFFASHPASRFLAGCSLLLAAIICHSLMLSVLSLTLSVYMIRILEGGWLTVVRLLRILRWFVLPIFLLHSLLSPGQLIMPGLPVTWEGVNQGVWLSIHLAAIFAAALLLSRLLQRSEWLQAIMLLPFAGRRIIVFRMMITTMQIHITAQLRHLKQQWNLRPDWRMAAVFLLASFCMALGVGREQARMLWLRWPAAGNGMHMNMVACERCISYNWTLSLAWVCAGFAGIVLAWL